VALSAVALAVLAAPIPSLAASSRQPAYCTIPTEKTNQPWGFHTGPAITGPTGSYAHGHGNFNPTARTADGIMCQVDRVRNQPDHQIILRVTHFVYYSHTAMMWGYPGNLVKLRVRVRQSTDSSCPVGTIGLVTIFASYNNIHQDSVKFWFPAACRSHRHLYHSQSVVTNVMPA
jgi:hypothetical protein